MDNLFTTLYTLSLESIIMSEIGEGKKRFNLRDFMKSRGRTAFWVWVGYQAVKGTLTTSFIWVPLIYFWFTR